MTSISSIGSSAWSSIASQSQKLNEKLTQKFDGDGSGALNTDELQSMMDDMSSRSGVAASSRAQDLLSNHDANSDGSLDADELVSALGSMQLTPSTMAFAQSRGSAGDDLFAKVDADGSGSVDLAEMTSVMSEMQGSVVSEEDAQAMFAALDSDGDGALSQAEFDAGRPQEALEATTTAQGRAPASGAGGAAPAGGASGASNDTYDELDTNEDGVVSEVERLVGELKESLKTGGKDADTDVSSQTYTAVRSAMMQVVNQAYEAVSGASKPSVSTFSYTV